jgi:hypothetical protein
LPPLSETSWAYGELPAGVLGPADSRGDVAEVERENLTEHEHRPLERTEPLEQEQRRHRHGVRQLGGALGVVVRVVDERFGEPVADIRLALTRADLSTSMESRVTTADRKDLVDLGSVAEVWKRTHVSWTASSASLTLPRIR